MTRILSLLIGGAFVVLIAVFSLSDLISVTGGRAALMAGAFGVSYVACAIVAAALILVLMAGERMQRRRVVAEAPNTPVTPGRWIGAAVATGWVAFVTSPFLAPAVVAGDWEEAIRLPLLVGGLIIGFLVAVMLLAALAGARKAG